MPEPTPPLFHSRARSRTRPAHRRVPVGLEPDLAHLRRRLSRTSVILAAFIAIVGIGTAAVRQARSDAPEVPVAPAVPAGAVPVAVARIVDGDTLDVRSAETTLRVRLYGVDTPERGQACFAEATQRLGALAGQHVLLVPDARAQDAFGRELRYVFTSDGRSVDYALVAEGLARAWREDGSRRAELIAAEDAARAARIGCLWARAPQKP